MAKKVEEKKTVKKVEKKTTPKKKEEKKVEVVEEEVLDFEEYDDEETNEVKPVYKEKKKKPKKVKKKKKEDVLGDSLLKQNAEIVNFFKILIAVLIFIGVFYLIVALVRGEIGKKNSTKKEEVETTIQNDEILASSVFNKKDKEYYVLLYDVSDENMAIYEMMYSDYRQNGNTIPMFFVNLNSKFNKDIVSEKSNSKAQKYSELKVVSPTLIHIKNGKNVDYYEKGAAREKLIKLSQ